MTAYLKGGAFTVACSSGTVSSDELARRWEETFGKLEGAAADGNAPAESPAPAVYAQEAMPDSPGHPADIARPGANAAVGKPDSAGHIWHSPEGVENSGAECAICGGWYPQLLPCPGRISRDHAEPGEGRSP